MTITIQNGTSSNIRLPRVDGLEIVGTRAATNIMLNNGAFSSAFTEIFQLQPTRAGDFTIPAFDIPLSDGGSLHVQAMKVHVLDNANAPSPVTVQPIPNATTNVPPAAPAFNPNGPVVMPPATVQAPDTTENVNVPVESDGRPAKVFIVITPQTTDAYVGQSIPLRIEFYIREDVDYQQDSLPTIKGSDFLMNDFSVRPIDDSAQLLNEQFRVETWITAISAPKSGDFPLQMERDTYWIKSTNGAGGNPFANFLFNNHPDLAHQTIPSNLLTMHIHPLPDEGRPDNFTGAIGQLKVTGSAQPLAVSVGEPVTLHFEVSGQGNFDYVRCPSLAEDPAWKAYFPSSKIQYEEQTHTQAVKTFEQSIIPQKNGTLPLPQATFSYFDPTAKHYVTIPVELPTVTVTGTPVAANSTPPGAATAANTTPQAAQFLPNRLAIGSLHASLVPAWRRPWFWAIQGSLVVLLLLGSLFAIFRGQPDPEDDRAGRIQRQNSLHQETDAMSDAVRRGDALAFFLAARHAVQLQLAANWRVQPEALTLWEIRQRDPQLAGTLEPLFTQADEIIYSGGTTGELDLAQWERHVRELLQPQPQTA